MFKQCTGIGLVALLLIVGGAAGAKPANAAESASIQAVLNPNGSGGMIANSQTNPEGETWSWESCTPALVDCRPFAGGRMVETTGASPETIFRVTSSRGATTLSPVWHGTVAPAAPPTISGTVRANELVTPIPGGWHGGWAGDVDWTQLAACTKPSDGDCTTLTHRHYTDGCPNGAAVLDPAFTGRFLRVADQRVPAHTPELAFAVGSPYGPDIWRAGPTVSVAFVGRIVPATGLHVDECGPSALVEASISSRGIATVRCGLGCSAVLVARQKTRRAHLARKLNPLPFIPQRSRDIPTLRLSRQSLARFEPGQVLITVRVDGRKVARRTVQVR